MEWSPDSSVKLVSGDEADADLVLVGVFAPATKEDVDEDENEDEEIGELLLEGDALELDNKLGGMLKDLAAENKKEFKNGGESGGVTPAGRVSDGGKVSSIVFSFDRVKVCLYCGEEKSCSNSLACGPKLYCY